MILGLSATLACVLLPAAQTPSGGDDPRELDRARAAVVRDAVARIAPSIVTIETVGGAQPGAPQPAASQPAGMEPPGRGRPQRQPRQAAFRVADGPTTGLIWSADGWIVSSSFNFVRNPIVTTVLMSDPVDGQHRRFVARLVARDLIRRIALLKVEAAGLPAPEWISASDLKPGQTAIACGRGYGTWLAGPPGSDSLLQFPSISVGIVSAAGRRNGNAIQIDAKTSPANYGGPVISLDGRVMGLIVPLAGAGEEMAGLEWYDSGIGFAVTRDSIDRVIDRLKSGESLEPGKMGITIGDAPDLRCRVMQVIPGSPADRAGILRGDIVTALNGQPVGDRNELLRRISDQAAGQEVVLQIERGESDKHMDIRLTLARTRDIGQVPPEDEDGEPSTQPSSQPGSPPNAPEPQRP